MFDLEKYVDQFIKDRAVSKPIFKASGDKTQIYFELDVRVHHDKSDYEDALDKLILDNMQESFNIDAHPPSFKNHCDANNVYRKMFDIVLKTYEKTVPLKNPRSSAVYKWLNGLSRSSRDDTHEGIIALYRYIGAHADVASSRYDGNSLPKQHADNVLAILGKMRDKYDR